jgi:hypothetical protein
MSDKKNEPVSALATRCNHCDKKDGIFAPATPVIGQPQDAAYFTLATMMCAHLQQKHPKVFARIMQGLLGWQMRFSHLAYLREFTIIDPDLVLYLDRSRHGILRTAQLRVPDSKLEEQVNRLASIRTDDHNDAEHYLKKSDVLALVKELRDVLQEELLYPEMQPGDPAKVILAP